MIDCILLFSATVAISVIIYSVYMIRQTHRKAIQ